MTSTSTLTSKAMKMTRQAGQASRNLMRHSKNPISTAGTSSIDITRTMPAEMRKRQELEERLEDEHDHVGPVCPRSNLRPMRYAKPFSSSPFSRSVGDSKSRQCHPYSLEEFNTHREMGFQKEIPKELIELRSKLELEDLQWTFFRTRVDRHNQTFWESQSTRFESLESQHHLAPLDPVDLNRPQQQQQPALSEGRPPESSPSLDAFYRHWLRDEHSRFMKFNRTWWSFQLGLLTGGWKSSIRMLKWKVACWRYL